MNASPWNIIRKMYLPSTRTFSDNLKLFVLLVLCASRSQCFSRGHFDGERQDGVIRRTNVLDNSSARDFDCFDDSGDCSATTTTRHEKKRRHFRTEDEDERPGKWLSKNFIMTDNLPDGEKEVRIHFNGITAKETSVVTNGTGLVLRQFTDGHHFMQTILMADGNLQDCEYVDQKSAIKDFVRTFRKEIRGNSQVSLKNFGRKHNKNNKKHNRGQGRRSDVEMNQRADQTGKRLHEHVKVHDRPGYADNLDIQNYSESENYEEKLAKENSIEKGEGDFNAWVDGDMADELGQNRTRRIKRQQWRSRNRRKISHIENGLWNVTVEELESQLPEDVSDWLDFDKTKLQCDKIHEQLKREHGVVDDQENLQQRKKRSLRSLAIVPGTLWCGAGQLAKSHGELGPLSGPDACCRAHDYCPVRIHGLEYKHGLLNRRPHTVSHCVCDKRSPRVVRSTVLIPGTRWCGKGNSGIQHNHLGEFAATDRCCRKHDNACPFWIEAMEKKYGMFNWRPNTLMHCRCDERFRSCLKLTDSDVGNMVGRIFFNVVQTKCFVLKPVKVCLERSWWGKCLKVGYSKQAHLRDNLPY